MKLLFDENISYKLEARVQDIFPGSCHVKSLSLASADDDGVWVIAKEEGYAIVTKDSDFNDRSIVFDFPPHVVWLRCGNSRVADIEWLLRKHKTKIEAFVNKGRQGVIEIGQIT